MHNRKQRRLSTAKHEAGHGLVLLALDIPFESIEIMPDEITIDTPNMGFVLDRGDLCLGVVRTDAVAWLMGGHCMEADLSSRRFFSEFKKRYAGKIKWRDVNKGVLYEGVGITVDGVYPTPDMI